MENVDKRHDLVLVAIWDFQSSKADIIWRCIIAAHVDKLQKEGCLESNPKLSLYVRSCKSEQIRQMTTNYD